MAGIGSFIAKNSWIIWLIVIAAAVIAIVGIIRRKIRSAASSLFGGLKMSDLSYAIKSAREAETNPSPRTVFGATSIYLPQILKDFPDFHESDAVAAVKKLIFEYLSIKYEGLEKFSDLNVEPGLERMVDVKTKDGNVTGEKVHAVAISKYEKTKEYATITYQASVGYSVEGKPTEERYAVEYTLKLRENDIEQKTLICPQCGGAFDSTSQTVCPYCGSGIIRDTIMSWKFSSIENS